MLPWATYHREPGPRAAGRLCGLQESSRSHACPHGRGEQHAPRRDRCWELGALLGNGTARSRAGRRGTAGDRAGSGGQAGDSGGQSWLWRAGGGQRGTELAQPCPGKRAAAGPSRWSSCVPTPGLSTASGILMTGDFGEFRQKGLNHRELPPAHQRQKRRGFHAFGVPLP